MAMLTLRVVIGNRERSEAIDTIRGQIDCRRLAGNEIGDDATGGCGTDQAEESMAKGENSARYNW